MKKILVALTFAAMALTGCNNDGPDAAEDRVEDTAEASAKAAGPTPVALGLSEAQLLDTDLLGIDGVEAGSVKSLLRNAEGRVDRLLIEVENSDPDRFVEVPVQGLTVLMRGDDTDLVSLMTSAQLIALPDAPLPAN